MSDKSSMPLTSFHWGTYRVETKDGKVTALHEFEEDVDPSPIGPGIVDVLDDPLRITSPMIRKSWLENDPGPADGKRGADTFVAVDWETAEKLVASELDRVRKNYGNQSIFAGSYGWASAGRFHHAQSQIHRFLNCIGGYTRSVNTYSFAAAEVLVPHVLGDYRSFLYPGTEWRSVIANTELFVAFGGVPLKNGQISQGGVGKHRQREAILQAKEAGIEFVNLSPLKTDIIDEINAQWLAPRPSTDTAILLGLCHILLDEGLHDVEFLEKHTEGFPRFYEYLSGLADGQPKSAEWAAKICGLEANELRELARRMAKSRTMISVSWSLTRQDHGEQPFWAAIALASMLGQVGLPGGGVSFGYSAVNTVGNETAKLPAVAVPQGKNNISSFIPVARITDLLMNPGGTFSYNGKQHTYPDTKIVYWAGGNPFHHHQDLNKMVEAWQKPDTIIVNEWCWNSLAKHADIILPCTTTLERNDLAMAPFDPYIVSMEKSSEPPIGVRSDFEIFTGIARRMGVEAEFTEGRSEAEWIRWLYERTKQNAAEQKLELPTLEELRRKRWHKVTIPEKHKVMLEEFRANPELNRLKTPSGKIEIFSNTIADFNYTDCSGHPTWMEPVEWLGGDISQYPLHLISNQPKDKLHSQLDHGQVSRSGKLNKREPMLIHPEDAAARNIKDGDLVRLFNERGSCLCVAMISNSIRRQVIQVSTGAWFDPDESGMCKHGNPNVLTKDKGTSSLSQGPIAHSCLVEVEIYCGPDRPVTAFVPPDIIKKHSNKTS